MAEERKKGERKEMNGSADGEKKLAAVLKEGLEEDLGEIPEVSINIEELKKLEETDRKKRKQKRVRNAGVAAAAVIVCAVILYAVWPQSAVPVDADKNTEQKVEEKDGVVIINEGDVEGDSGEVSVTETDWNKVSDLKEYVPNLYIPGYVPEGYEFEKATVKRYSDEMYESEFCFVTDQKESLIITQTAQVEDDIQTVFVEDYEKKLHCELGDIYIVKHQKGISGTLINKRDRIVIFGEVSIEEIESLYKSLK